MTDQICLSTGPSYPEMRLSLPRDPGCVQETLSMGPGSIDRPEQALEASVSDADQGLGDDPQEEYQDAPDTMPTICGMVEDINSETSQVGSHPPVNTQWMWTAGPRQDLHFVQD